MVVIAPYVQARRERHASLYLTRLGSPAPESPGDPRAVSLLDIRSRLDALRLCPSGQASVTRSNALLFACLLRHGAPDPHQTIVLRWFVRHAHLHCHEAFPLPRARRGLRKRVTGVLAVWHLAPRTVVWGWITGGCWHLSASFVVALTWTAGPAACRRQVRLATACQKFEVSRSCGKIELFRPQEKAIPVRLLICFSNESHQWHPLQ
jgi:hypothetical protein